MTHAGVPPAGLVVEPAGTVAGAADSVLVGFVEVAETAALRETSGHGGASPGEGGEHNCTGGEGVCTRPGGTRQCHYMLDSRELEQRRG